jgi:hypothetical protein
MGLGAALAVTAGLALAWQIKGDVKQTTRTPKPIQATAPTVEQKAEVLPDAPHLLVGQTLEWSADKYPDETLRRAGPYLVKIRAREEDELVAPEVEVSAAGQTVRMKGQTVSSTYSHRISLFQNQRGGAPVLMLQSFSGGAHCCNTVTLAGFSNGSLKTLELGSWDGDNLPLPKDINKDGVADIVVSDNSFLYAFASYASSYAPPQILNVRNGKVLDVSRGAGYRPLFAETMREAGEQCTSASDGDSRNGACPAYVATAARLGKLGEAWRRMLAAYDPSTDWDFPTGCKVSRSPCPAGAEVQAKSYPEALLNFLRSGGYVPRGWQPPEYYQTVEGEEDESGPVTDEI